MAPSGLHSFWEENLRSLETINPGLANQLQTAPREGIVYAVEREYGNRFLCRALKRQEHQSLFDSCPVIEGARSFAEGEWIHAPQEEKLPALSERDLLQNDLFIVVRMGLGNEVLDLYNRLALVEFFRNRNRRILALEDRIDLVRAAFTLYDWRIILESSRFLLLCGNDLGALLRRFLDRYSFSAVARPFVQIGSGTVEHSARVADEITNVVETVQEKQCGQAQQRLQALSKSPALRKSSHVRKVLWLVPGHNYLQKCSVQALQQMGVDAVHHLWSAPLYRYVKRYEWIRLLKEYAPDALVMVNATPATFFDGDEIGDLSVLVATWFVDNPQRYVRDSKDLSGVDLVASFDREYLSYLEDIGATRLREIRTAAGLDGRDIPNQPDGPTISFVGELGTRGFWAMEQLLNRSLPHLRSAVDSVIEEYALSPGQNLEDLCRRHLDIERFPFRGSMVELIENKATYRRRRMFLEEIHDMGLTVFGDPEWGNPQHSGCLAHCWAGRRLDYFSELPSVYAGSQINVNILHSQCRSGLNPRVYDVLACGGFLLTSENPGISDEFVDGEHLVTFRTPDELRDQVRYYLDHPEERQRIAEAGRRRVLASCRYHDRMRHFLGVFDRILAGDTYVYPC